jgi:hypothetical protein
MSGGFKSQKFYLTDKMYAMRAIVNPQISQIIFVFDWDEREKKRKGHNIAIVHMCNFWSMIYI